jgi:hypothetical protein
MDVARRGYCPQSRIPIGRCAALEGLAWFGSSIPVGSETFNRRHRPYGYAKATHRVTILRPRMMETMVTSLPDGATVVVRGD